MSAHFSFVKMVVGDLDASAAFYEGVFGLVPLVRISTTVDGRDMTEIVYNSTADGGGKFTLVAYRDTPNPPLGELILGFQTEDLDTLLGQVSDHGGAVSVAPFTSPETGGMTVAFATDPDGHVIEVVQRT